MDEKTAVRQRDLTPACGRWDFFWGGHMLRQWMRCAHLGLTVAPSGGRFARTRRPSSKHRTTSPGHHEEVDSVSSLSQSPALHLEESAATPVISFGAALKRPSGFVTAEAPSLAQIRSEIEQLRKAKQEEAFARTLASTLRGDSSAIPASDKRSASADASSSLFVSPLERPSYSLQDETLRAGVSMSEYFRQKRLATDSHEILRKRSPHDSVRLAAMIYPERATFESTAARHELAQRFLQKIRDKLLAQAPPHDARSNAIIDDAVASQSGPLFQLALFQVLEEISDQELQQLLRNDLIDILWWTQDGNVADEVDDNNNGILEGEEADYRDSDGDGSVPSPLQLELALGKSSALVKSLIDELRFAELPNADVAPAVARAQAGDYGSITATDLKKLEGYETGDGSVAARALGASSPLLQRLGQTDEKLRRSLAILDRAKRHALLDREFQAAVEYASSHTASQVAGMQARSSKPRTPSADVPFFFGNARSQPPPSADMNLPEPALSTEERRAIRRKRRIARIRQQFQR